MVDKKIIIISSIIIAAGFAVWYLFGSRTDVSDIRQSTDAIRTELGDAQRENSEARGHADTIAGGLKDIKDGIGRVSDRVESATGKIDNANSRIGSAQRELGSIREIIVQDESIYRSVREAGPIKNQ